jgi:hypothetical protein
MVGYLMGGKDLKKGEHHSKKVCVKKLLEL